MQLLEEEKRATGLIQEKTGRDRSTISRWRRGICYPDREAAAALIEMYPGRLDYNGCYQHSIEVSE